MSTPERMNYSQGQSIEVKFPEGWKPGVFLGFTDGDQAESFERLLVIAERKNICGPISYVNGAHPDCVRPSDNALSVALLRAIPQDR